MPKYYFHLRGASEGANDLEGEEFADDVSAIDHLVASIRVMSAESRNNNAEYALHIFDVINEEGQLVASISFGEVFNKPRDWKVDDAGG